MVIERRCASDTDLKIRLFVSFLAFVLGIYVLF